MDIALRLGVHLGKPIKTPARAGVFLVEYWGIGRSGGFAEGETYY